LKREEYREEKREEREKNLDKVFEKIYNFKNWEEKMRRVRRGFGLRDGSQRGWLRGGRGRNRTSNCRHPLKRKRR